MSIEERIHFVRAIDSKPVFGAIAPTLTKFLQIEKHKNKIIFKYESEKHGIVYLTEPMFKRVYERYKILKMDTEILEQPLYKYNQFLFNNGQ